MEFNYFNKLKKNAKFEKMFKAVLGSRQPNIKNIT